MAARLDEREAQARADVAHVEDHQRQRHGPARGVGQLPAVQQAPAVETLIWAMMPPVKTVSDSSPGWGLLQLA